MKSSRLTSAIHLDDVATPPTMALRHGYLPDKYMVMELRIDADTQFTSDDLSQFDGSVIFLSKGGSYKLTLNQQEITITPRSLLALPPHSVIQFQDIRNGYAEGWMLFLSTEFLREISLDINIIDVPRILSNMVPMHELDPKRYDLFVNYMELLYHNATGNSLTKYKIAIAGNLTAALIYQLFDLITGSKVTDASDDAARSSRKHAILSEFVRLLSGNFRQEHNVKFYADRLCITPKYLSQIVRETSGMSAPQWIDRLLLMEAKKLLLYSGFTVQQTAYQLNFMSQSAFGKYFKRLTGLSPTEYMDQHRGA